MGGIVGLIQNKPITDGSEKLERSIRTIARRGSYSKEKLVEEKFIISQLSTELRSTGNEGDFKVQKAEKSILIIDGEIYNSEELIKNYNLNIDPKNSAKIILELYLRHGIQAFREINGIYAFIILNTETMEIVCVRDRLGVKPFYFYCSEEIFAFASRPRALFFLSEILFQKYYFKPLK